MPHKSSGSGIYCIKNNINGKVYIGQAYRLERRLYEHRYYLNLGKDKATALQRAVSKYGLNNFEFSVLEYCSPEDLNDREIFYIKEFDSHNKKHGYNLSLGGESGLIGYKHSEETKRKISEGKKGWIMGQAQRLFISALHKGKVISDETRKKMSIANTKENHPMWGKHHSPETIQHYKEVRGAESSYQFGTKKDGARSQYFGVYRVPRKGHVYWMARIKIHGESIYIGSSKDEIEAARMYDQYVIENGLPNPLNFPED